MTIVLTAGYLIFLFISIHLWGRWQYRQGWVDGFEARIKSS